VQGGGRAREGRRRPLGCWVSWVVCLLACCASGIFGDADLPVLGSSFALFRFSKMSLMDLIVPFLLDRQFLMRAYAVLTACVVTYILKLPPTKNWRPMLAVF
jgi:hypothetical protein